MTAADLPPVHSPGDAFLAAIARRQDETNDLLAQIRDRLPAPAADNVAADVTVGPVTVELREPLPAATRVAEPPIAKVAEPAPEPVAELSEPVDEPAPRPARASKRTIPKKGGSR